MMQPTAASSHTATHTTRSLERAETKIVRPSSSSLVASVSSKLATLSLSTNRTSDKKESMKITELIRTSFRDLNASDFTEESISEIVCFLQESMSVPARTYHVMDHVLEVATGPGRHAISQLAGLFHDVVYITDGAGSSALTRAQAAFLKDVATSEARPCWNNNNKAFDTKDAELRTLVMSLFGYNVDQLKKDTPPAGWNEFLSALIAARVLRPYLSTAQIAQIVICIEATIPFRHEKIMQDLYERLKQVVEEHDDIQLRDKECVETIHMATAVANVDVDNFAYSNPALFLDKTWALLPEMNACLRNPNYSCWDYREAIRKMHGFFSFFLNPQLVFHGFQGRHADVLKQDTVKATRNVEIAKRYLTVKLTSATLLCALSVLVTGNVDLPLNQLVGPDWLALAPQSRETSFHDEIDTDVYGVLCNGRVAKTEFDTRESPLAALLFEALQGSNGVQEVVTDESFKAASCRDISREGARGVLHRVPSHVVDLVMKHVSTTVKDDLIRSMRE